MSNSSDRRDSLISSGSRDDLAMLAASLAENNIEFDSNDFPIIRSDSAETFYPDSALVNNHRSNARGSPRSNVDHPPGFSI
jgi:hypothetical protein